MNTLGTLAWVLAVTLSTGFLVLCWLADAYRQYARLLVWGTAITVGGWVPILVVVVAVLQAWRWLT